MKDFILKIAIFLWLKKEEIRPEIIKIWEHILNKPDKWSDELFNDLLNKEVGISIMFPLPKIAIETDGRKLDYFSLNRAEMCFLKKAKDKRKNKIEKHKYLQTKKALQEKVSKL